MNNIIVRKVIDITKDGLTLESTRGKIYIDFNDCVNNFFLEKGGNGKCVATRNITTLSFVFYTHPKTYVIFKRRVFKDIIRGSATKAFLYLQKAIVEVGYTSYDLS